MSMSIPEARAELKQLFDQSFAIMAKTGGRITDETTNDDRAQLEQNKANILGLEIRLQGLLDSDADSDFFTKGRDEYGRPSEPHRQPSTDRRGAYARSIGAGVAASDEYAEAKRSGQLNLSRPQLQVTMPAGVSLADAAKSAGREQKALLTSSDTSAGGFVINDRLPGWTPLTRGELALLDLLPTQNTTSDMVEYVVQTTRTNAAAAVAEATASSGASGAKPESALAWNVVQAPVQQIATHIPATTRILNDLGALRSMIDDDLLYMLQETLEQQCVIGNGTPPNLQGINTAPGIQTMAAGALPIDAIFNASLACRFSGGVAATAAIVGANSLAALRLARENAASGTLGGYIMGPPNMPGPLTIFGLTVAVATAVPANVAFVLNLTPTTIALVEREGGTIETGWINDQFTRNLVTVRAELRAVLAIRRPLGIVKLTGMP
jgi:HK97 family phage major capsid protein